MSHSGRKSVNIPTLKLMGSWYDHRNEEYEPKRHAESSDEVVTITFRHAFTPDLFACCLTMI